ncbi:MAG TPA: MBL fold metallo-hydrolase [Spirochaetia bacterium]|nr:MBL fold metallo-hydrolase [Spirochaetia bacterium]
MKTGLIFEKQPSDIHECLKEPLQEGEVQFWWLGQAGFIFRSKKCVVAVDLYLSDFLAQKYKQHEFSHERMLPPPLLPEEVDCLDYYLCTHAHSDHMDPGTIPTVSRNNPACVFVVPRAETDTAHERGIPAPRLLGLDDGEDLPLSGGGNILAMAAAHETLERNEEGHHRYLSYLLILSGLRIFHSGDAVPYPGLAEKVAAMKPDLALLPVNGRDAVRSGRGIAGNFSASESMDLIEAADIAYGLGHHYGMFAFNSADPETVRRQIGARGFQDRFALAEIGLRYRLSKDDG